MRAGMIGAVALAAIAATPAAAREARTSERAATAAQVTRTAATKPVVKPTQARTTQPKTAAAKSAAAKFKQSPRKSKTPTVPVIDLAANGGGSMVTCAGTMAPSTCLSFDGNLNSNSAEAQLDAAIEQLLGSSFDFNFQAVEGTKDFFSFNGDDPLGILTFDEALFGSQILSVKIKNNTLLYLFDFGTSGATSVQLNLQGLSNALLITPGTGGTGGSGGVGAVPEPGTWAMMLLGFGATGVVMRRRRRSGKLIQQIA